MLKKETAQACLSLHLSNATLLEITCCGSYNVRWDNECPLIQSVIGKQMLLFIVIAY